MQKSLLWAIILIIVLGGAFFFWQSSQMADTDVNVELGGNSPVATTTDDEPGAGEDTFDALVSFTADGFSPSPVTIKKGQTVRFVNNATVDVWPASAAHPTHRVYPGSDIAKCGTQQQSVIFDSCRGLKAGEFWEFTFNEVGTWNYHDHLNASKFGRIIVTE